MSLAMALLILAIPSAGVGQTPQTAPYDHVHLSVPDPAKAAEWYIKYMGGAKGPGVNEVSFGSTI